MKPTSSTSDDSISLWTVFRVDVRMLTQHLPALRHVLVACAVFPGVIASEPGPDYGVTATFSIVAVDPDTGVCGDT